MQTPSSNWLCLLGLVPCILVSGCMGNSSTTQAEATVTGIVTLDGSPVQGATVTFRPEESGGSGAFGMTDEEGKYTLNTSNAVLGVKPGQYKISVTKLEAATSDAPSEEDPSYGGAPTRESAPKNLLPEKYSKVDSSGLTADIQAGENDVPLQLSE